LRLVRGRNGVIGRLSVGGRVQEVLLGQRRFDNKIINAITSWVTLKEHILGGGRPPLYGHTDAGTCTASGTTLSALGPKLCSTSVVLLPNTDSFPSLVTRALCILRRTMAATCWLPGERPIYTLLG
jgi:hypothetical protein